MQTSSQSERDDIERDQFQISEPLFISLMESTSKIFGDEGGKKIAKSDGIDTRLYFSAGIEGATITQALTMKVLPSWMLDRMKSRFLQSVWPANQRTGIVPTLYLTYKSTTITSRERFLNVLLNHVKTQGTLFQ